MNPEPDHDPAATCDRCGREAAGAIGDEVLCENCCHEAGSCCGQYGSED